MSDFATVTRAAGAVLLMLIIALCAGCAAATKGGQSVTKPSTKKTAAGDAPTENKAPIARRGEHVNTYHGVAIPDPYHWLRSKKDPKVRAYLEAENRHTAAWEKAHAPLKKALYAEFIARLQEDDADVPWRKGPWLYYDRTEKGRAYRIYCRKPAAGGPEQVLLDVNALAKGHKHVALGGLEVSENHKLLAYSVDFDGSEIFELRVRDLATGKDLGDRVPGVYYGVEWGNDNATLFYTTPDNAHRPYRWRRHVLGEPASKDVTLHQEDDERFHLYLGKSRSGRFVTALMESAITSEIRFVDADKPRSKARLLAKRRQGIEYSAVHHGEHWYIKTNDGAIDFKLMRAPLDKPSVAHWKVVVPGRDGVLLEGVGSFRDFLVLRERKDGQRRIRVRVMAGATRGGKKGGEKGANKVDDEHTIKFEEPVHTVGLKDNRDYNTTTLRLSYTSMKTPQTVLDYDMRKRTRKILKVKPVRGGYDASRYVTERLWATSHDGVKVPVSIVRRRDVKKGGKHPCHLKAYAAYGYSYEPRFDRERIALLERGFVVAIAHARGGSVLGRKWKQDGKLEHKRNTFEDVAAVAKMLADEGWTTASKLGLQGGSAGGLMVGATINAYPERFGAAIANVPFVDVLNTMMDAKLPLTVVEWEEWGNPNKKRFFDVIRAYSPYDNVRAVRYPDLFVTAGLNDPRVHYWEPAKWVARLRHKAKGGLVLLKTKMEAGHGGASGRYENLADEAGEYAFLINRLGASTKPLPLAP